MKACHFTEFQDKLLLHHELVPAMAAVLSVPFAKRRGSAEHLWKPKPPPTSPRFAWYVEGNSQRIVHEAEASQLASARSSLFVPRSYVAHCTLEARFEHVEIMN